MNVNIPTELLELTLDTSYQEVWISTDKRQPDPDKTTMKYAQLGGPNASDKIGNTYGNIFRIEVLAHSGSATHLKVWGRDNDDSNAVLIPLTRFFGTGYANPTLDIWLKKFDFTDSDGAAVTPSSYTVIGHRGRSLSM